MSEMLAGPVVPAATDRSGPLILTGVSSAGRAIPVSLLASLPGLMFFAGYDHLAYGLGLLAGVVLAALLIAPKLSRARAATATGALAAKFGPVTASVATLVLIAVVLPLLAAELSLLGTLGEHTLGIAYPWALIGALLLVAASALLLDDTRLGAVSALAYPLLAASLFVPLVLIASNAGGFALPHAALGHALVDLRAIEEKLLENGLVDFDTFSAHAAPFIRLAQLDVFALVLTLAFGAAVLPHLLSGLAAGRRAAATRFAGAWTALFVMILLAAVPALAVFAKLEIYGAIAKGTPLTETPSWLEAPLRSEFARLHGTSVHLLEQVTEAVRHGSQDPEKVAAAFAGKATDAQQWQALDLQTQEALLASARTVIAEPAPGIAWDVYRTTVLPAAAAAAGNEAAVLTQSGLAIEPVGLLLALPGLTGFPHVVWLLFAVAGLIATLATATSLVRAVMALGRKHPEQDAAASRPRFGLWTVVAFVIVAIAAGIAALRAVDLVTLVVSALALAGAGLFPALAVGLAWRRATAAGVIAAIIVGSGVTLYYMAGTNVFPQHFYTTWPALSNAGEAAIEEYTTLETEMREGETDEAKAAAKLALDELTHGTSTRAGVANWAGVSSASSAVFGAPVGLFVLVLVSLVTPSRRRREPTA